MPLFWDFIEPNVKGKRQLLLSWCNSLLSLLFLLEELKLCTEFKVERIVDSG